MRFLRRCAAYGLAGALLNAALAYALASLCPLPVGHHPATGRFDQGWKHTLPARLPEPDRSLVARNFAITHWQTSHAGPSSAAIPEDYVINAYRVGLPMRTFEGWSVWLAPGNTLAYEGPRQGLQAEVLCHKWFAGYMIEGRPYLSWMPLRPLWLGMLVNALGYGALLWLLLGSLAAVRRARRRRRGLCPACAYPTSGGTRCPECGRVVTPRSR